jgi:nucleotidyltransferase substrate binding protein (TIGR01987 family)
MSQRKLTDSIANLNRALDSFEEAVNTDRTSPLVAEGTIQRFEFTVELFWKTLKRALEYEGKITKTPRETLKETYAVGWVSEETIWLEMLDSRNDTSHLYLDPALVDAMYEKVKGYYPEMRRLFVFIKARYASAPCV